MTSAEDPDRTLVIDPTAQMPLPTPEPVAAPATLPPPQRAPRPGLAWRATGGFLVALLCAVGVGMIVALPDSPERTVETTGAVIAPDPTSALPASTAPATTVAVSTRRPASTRRPQAPVTRAPARPTTTTAAKPKPPASATPKAPNTKAAATSKAPNTTAPVTPGSILEGVLP